jgi:hypothetical protein
MKKTNIILKKLVLNISELDHVKDTPGNIRITSEMSEDAAFQIVNNISEKKGTSVTVTVALIAGLAQNGGTNKGAGSSAKFSFEEKTLTAQELTTQIRKVQENGTIRQLARTMADDIAAVSTKLGIEGDLANQMRYDYPDLSHEEAVWCSNFQTTNINCPVRVRNWLVDNYRKRFNR